MTSKGEYKSNNKNTDVKWQLRNETMLDKAENEKQNITNAKVSEQKASPIISRPQNEIKQLQFSRYLCLWKLASTYHNVCLHISFSLSLCFLHCTVVLVPLLRLTIFLLPQTDYGILPPTNVFFFLRLITEYFLRLIIISPG